MSTNAISLLELRMDRSRPAAASLRLVLLPGEVLSLPHRPSRIRVLSGTAWVSKGGRDFVLARGEQMNQDVGRDFAVVSGLGSEALLFEVLQA